MATNVMRSPNGQPLMHVVGGPTIILQVTQHDSMRATSRDMHTHALAEIEALIKRTQERRHWLPSNFSRLVDKRLPPPQTYIIIGATTNWYTAFRDTARQEQDNVMLRILGERVFLLPSWQQVWKLILWLREGDGSGRKPYKGDVHIQIATKTALEITLPEIWCKMMPFEIHGWRDDDGRRLVKARCHPPSLQSMNHLFDDIELLALDLKDNQRMSADDMPMDPTTRRQFLEPPSQSPSAPSTPQVMNNARALEEALPGPSPVQLTPPGSCAADRTCQVSSSETHDASLASSGEGELYGAAVNSEPGERALYVDLHPIHERLEKRSRVAEVGVAILDSGLGPEAPRGSSVQIQRARNGWAHITRHELPETNLETVDRVGHGTNVVTLLLKSCPFAKVITYKVVKDVKDHRTGGYKRPRADAHAVAKALRKAHKNQVDIIIMSLGFEEKEQCIEEELLRIENIDREKNRRTFIFSATSNAGLVTNPSKSISYPASRQGVNGVCAAQNLGIPDPQAPFIGEGPIDDSIFFFHGFPGQLFGLDGEPKANSDGAASWATPNLAGQVAQILQIVRTYASDVGRPHAARVQEYTNQCGLDPIFKAKAREFSKCRHPHLLLTEVFQKHRDCTDVIDSVIENLHDIYTSASSNIP